MGRVVGGGGGEWGVEVGGGCVELVFFCIMVYRYHLIQNHWNILLLLVSRISC